MALTKQERRQLNDVTNALSKLRRQVECGLVGHSMKIYARISRDHVKVGCSKCGITCIREMTWTERKAASFMRLGSCVGYRD